MSEKIPLPLLATVKAAYGDVLGNIGGFAKAISVIVLMTLVFVELPNMMLTEYIYNYIHPDKKVEATVKTEVPAPEETKKAPEAEKKQPSTAMEEAERVQPEHMAMLMGLNLLQMAIIVSFLVAWYRQLLFGENRNKVIFFRFGKNEWAFSKTLVKASLVMFPVMMVIMSYAIASIPELSEGKPEDISTTWPIFLISGVLLLYLIASLSMSYPLTIMGQSETPIKDSWRMTKPHVLSIIGGTLLMFIPTIIVATLLISGVSWLIHMPYQPVPGEVMSEDARDPFAISFCMKSIGAVFTIFLFALISAYHSRVYAFLVRSQQAEQK